MRKSIFSVWFTLLTLFIQVLPQTLAQEANLDTLQLVQAIIRHGERVPEYPYPNDPYNNETFWEEGWGQLTELGKLQEFELGKYLRTRYQDFLAPKYVANEIYVLSSDLDRTIMSAELCLTGLFLAENGSTWNPDIPYEPVPLHTIATEDDNLLRFKKKCPEFDAEFQNYLHNSPEMKKINTENKELFEYLSNYSGAVVTNIDEIDSFYATLMVEEMLGLKVPDWAVPVINTPHFQYLYNLAFASTTATPKLRRLKTGALVEYLVDNINTRVTNSSMKTKFFLLSAHDTTLVAILNTMGVLDLQRPYYGSVFFIELHRNPLTEEYFVQLFLRNDTTKAPYKLKMPGCELDCPLQQFQTYTEAIIPENWEAECAIASADDESSSILYYIAVVASGILVGGFAMYLICLVLKKKSRRTTKDEYQQF